MRRRWVTEKEKADADKSDRHPIVKLLLENPISALNAVAIVFGGGFVYKSNEARMEAMEMRIVQIERMNTIETASANAKESATTVRVDAISRDLGEVKVTVGRVETAVKYLVDQAREDRNDRRRQ
jgi:hypothetical protein